MKDSKDKGTKQFNFKRTLKMALRVCAHIVLILGFAYGLRQMFQTMRDELNMALTIVVSVFVAATAHLE